MVNGSEYIYEYQDERLIRERHEGNTVEYIYDGDSRHPLGFVFDNHHYIYTEDSEGHIVGIAAADNTASARYIFDEDWILQGIVTDDGSTGSDIYYAAMNNHYLGIGYFYDTETGLYYNGRYYSSKTGAFLGSVCDTADIGERNIQARASVDYDAEADSWAQELLNSNTYGRSMGDQYVENWFAQLSTVNAMKPSNNYAWRSATYLACLICLTQDKDNVYEVIGKPAYYSNQVFFYSYTSVWGNEPDEPRRLIGSGDNLQMLTWNGFKNVKDVAIVSLGTYTNSADIYTDYVFSQSHGIRNVFYNLR